MELVVRFEQLFGGNEKWLYRQYLIPREQTSVQNSFFYVPRVLRLKKKKEKKLSTSYFRKSAQRNRQWKNASSVRAARVAMNQPMHVRTYDIF